jgi:hypothetical protein
MALATAHRLPRGNAIVISKTEPVRDRCAGRPAWIRGKRVVCGQGHDASSPDGDVHQIAGCSVLPAAPKAKPTPLVPWENRA